MNSATHLEILPQPDDTTCGPTCLHAVYHYFGDDIELDQVIKETPSLEEGGTLASLLAGHALRRGYDVSLYSYNLRIFDPTWQSLPPVALIDKLESRLHYSRSEKRKKAVRAYIDVLKLGGRVLFEELTVSLLERILTQSTPVLTGLSSTYLYQCPREYGPKNEWDDIRGDPQGHFVVLCGYDSDHREVLVADPLEPNPFAKDHFYSVSIDRVLCAILLGVLTYDGNLLLIEPKANKS
ncbi:MAG: C39 family peptidase [Candidatus Hydrogenedentes bacterium]|nr:C39 family peptidase [Candidatus Hydrogenedentota bacterium]